MKGGATVPAVATTPAGRRWAPGVTAAHAAVARLQARPAARPPPTAAATAARRPALAGREGGRLHGSHRRAAGATTPRWRREMAGMALAVRPTTLHSETSPQRAPQDPPPPHDAAHQHHPEI